MAAAGIVQGAGLNPNGLSAAMVNGASTTAGNEFSNQFINGSGHRASWGSILRDGAVTTAGNYAGSVLSSGINAGTGMRGPGSIVIGNLTSALCRSALGSAVGGNSAIDWTGVGKVDPLAVYQNEKAYQDEKAKAPGSGSAPAGSGAKDTAQGLMEGLWYGMKNSFGAMAGKLVTDMSETGSNIASAGRSVYTAVTNPAETMSKIAATGMQAWEGLKTGRSNLGERVETLQPEAGSIQTVK